jgi:hypothetical protein
LAAGADPIDGLVGPRDPVLERIAAPTLRVNRGRGAADTHAACVIVYRHDLPCHYQWRRKPQLFPPWRSFDARAAAPCG